MGRPRSKNSVYFIEDEMVQILKQYRIDHSEETFKKIEPKIVAIINGMINKEFAYNTFIKNNREAAISECMLHILNSYHRFDPNKGRLYAYTNRIAKNRLTTFYKSHVKLKNKEVLYTDLNTAAIDNSNSEDIDTDDNILKISIIANNIECDNDTPELTNIEDALTKAKTKNVVLDQDTSIYIIYSYVEYIIGVLHYYLNGSDNIKKLVQSITYDYQTNFDFTKYYIKSNITAFDFYYNLIENLNFIFNNISKWLICNYPNQIKKEPEKFDGKLSNRIVNSIKKFMVNTFENNVLSAKFDSTELINFIQYLIKIEYIE